MFQVCIDYYVHKNTLEIKIKIIILIIIIINYEIDIVCNIIIIKIITIMNNINLL